MLTFFLIGCGEKHKLKVVLDDIEGYYLVKKGLKSGTPYSYLDTTYQDPYYIQLTNHHNKQLKVTLKDSVGNEITTGYYVHELQGTAPFKENLLYDPDVMFGNNDMNSHYYQRISLFSNDSVTLKFYSGSLSTSSTTYYFGVKK